MKIIILAGGSGTRLWPLSRDRYPKQFIKLQDGKPSLFQETFIRSAALAPLENIYVVTNEKYKFLVSGEIEELGFNFNESNILVEPEAKNTLPAIYAGVHEIMKKGNDFVAVFPSDHLISDSDEFIEIIKTSVDLAKNSIVTFGVKPDSPNTGYGYIEPGEILMNGFKVKTFREKPDLKTAVEYVSSGFLWNSGMFMFSADLFVDETIKHAESIYTSFKTSASIKEAFSKITEKISIDYGIMEKSDKVSVVPVDIGWSDLGSFDALYDSFDKDKNGNIIGSKNIAVDANNNYICSDDISKLIAVIGVDDIIAVDNKDALLICKKSESQKVKNIVDILKSQEDPRADFHMMDFRPWGNYRVIEKGKNFKVKHIVVNAGKRISYQLHHHRSEHWVVVSGMARVIINDFEQFVTQGESIFIKPGEKHRLENPGKIPLEIIEVQMGDYLEENDIVRFDDDYERD